MYLSSIFATYPDATILCGNDFPIQATFDILTALKIDLSTKRFLLAKRGTIYTTDISHSLILPTKSRMLQRDPTAVRIKSFLFQSIADRIITNPNPTEQIYISREGYRRHALNETVLIAILQQHMNLRVVKSKHLEKLSRTEQWATFANATLIIAPHGAAITNAMFCNREKVTVVELSGKFHFGSFGPDLKSWGIEKYHDIYLDTTDGFLSSLQYLFSIIRTAIL